MRVVRVVSTWPRQGSMQPAADALRARLGMLPTTALPLIRRRPRGAHMPGGRRLLLAGVFSVSLPLAFDAMFSHSERWSVGGRRGGRRGGGCSVVGHSEWWPRHESLAGVCATGFDSVSSRLALSERAQKNSLQCLAMPVQAV